MKASKESPDKVLDSDDMKRKHIVYAKENQRIFYAVSLLVLVIASMICSLIVVPMLLFFEVKLVYMIVLIMGLAFGFIFSYLMIDLRHLEKKHHNILGVVVPLTAILNLYIMVTLAVKMTQYIPVVISFNPLTVAAFYIMGIVVPYVFLGFVDYFHSRKK